MRRLPGPGAVRVTAAFPLAWPPNVNRTAAKMREKGSFKATLPSALENVRTSLTRFGQDSGIPVQDITLSSNVSLGINAPADPGIAVWFLWDGERRCIAVDRYTTPAGNLQAIHHVLEARRTEARHGTLHMVRASFSGLKALPPPTSGRHWSEVLGVSRASSVAVVEAAFKRLAAERHPDRGGSADAMAELNRARDEAKREAGA